MFLIRESVITGDQTTAAGEEDLRNIGGAFFCLHSCAPSPLRPFRHIRPFVPGHKKDFFLNNFPQVSSRVESPFEVWLRQRRKPLIPTPPILMALSCINNTAAAAGAAHSHPAHAASIAVADDLDGLASVDIARRSTTTQQSILWGQIKAEEELY